MKRHIKKWILIGTLVGLFFIALLTLRFFYIRADFIHAVSVPVVDYFHMWEYDSSSDIVCIVAERNKYLHTYDFTSNKYLFTASEDWWMFYKPSTIIKKEYPYRLSDRTRKYVSKVYQIYNLKTQQLIKEYTLEEIERRLPEEYRVAYLWEEHYIEKYGEPYIFLQVEKHNSDDTISGAYLEINASKDTICLEDTICDDGVSLMSRDYERALGVFWEWGTEDLYPLLQANGFSGEMKTIAEQDKKNKILRCYRGDYQGYANLVLTGPALPATNSKLYGMFPNLKQYIGNEDVTVNLLLSGAPSAEKIMKLVLEEGQEVSFEGCIMGAEYSKDGQEHEIRSFEDYYEWRKADE